MYWSCKSGVTIMTVSITTVTITGYTTTTVFFITLSLDPSKMFVQIHETSQAFPFCHLFSWFSFLSKHIISDHVASIVLINNVLELSDLIIRAEVKTKNFLTTSSSINKILGKLVHSNKRLRKPKAENTKTMWEQSLNVVQSSSASLNSTSEVTGYNSHYSVPEEGALTLTHSPQYP